MRLAKLLLKAFGPFSGTTLDFEREGSGLQVVYGVNEAGKSTALRAIHQFLFGIEPRTTDNFLHENSELRIGAVLIDQHGKRHSLMRRKGTKAVIFEFNEKTGEERGEKPIDQVRIAQLLPGVDEDLFKMLFGLSHDSLREGGRSLLSGAGDLGELLFAAGSGLTDVKSVVQTIDAEGKALFVSRGDKPKVNSAIREFEDQKRALRDAFVRPKTWKELEEALLSARSEQDTLEARLAEVQTERGKTQRLIDLRPNAIQRQNFLETLVGLQGTAKLSEDAKLEYSTARARVRAADEAIAEAEAKLVANRKLVEELVVSQAHLDEAAAIELQHHAAPGASDSRQQLVALEARLTERRTNLALLLSSLAPGQDVASASQLLPAHAVAAKLKALSRSIGQIGAERSAAETAKDKAVGRKGDAEAQLKDALKPGDASELEAAVDTVQKEGEPERALRVVVEKSKALDAEVNRRCTSLGLEEKVISSLAPPAKSVVERFKRAFEEIVYGEGSLDDEEEKLRDDIVEREGEIRQLEAVGTVVTAETLKQTRNRRDSLWVGVRQAYVEKSKTAATVKTELKIARDVSDEFEEKVRAADEQADLLHADTARVTRHAEYKERVAKMTGELEKIAAKREKSAAERQRQLAEWAKVLKALKLTDREPEDLLEWLRDREAVLGKIAERDQAAAQVRTLDQTIEASLGALRAAYGKAGLAVPQTPTLTALLTHARQQLRSEEEKAARIETLGKERKTAEREVEALQTQIGKLDDRLAQILKGALEDLKAIGLTKTATSEEIDSRIEELGQLGNTLRSVQEVEGFIGTAKATWDGFARSMATLAKRIGAPETGSPEDLLVLAATLYEALGIAKKAQSRREQLEAAIQSDEEQVAAQKAKRTVAQGSINDLIVAAKRDDASELDAAIEASDRLRAAERDLVALDNGLTHLLAHERDELLKVAAQDDPGRLQAELSRMEGDIASLGPEIKTAQTKTADAKAALEKINGSEAAAIAREAMEQSVASIQRDAADYVRIRLAHVLLSKAIRTYQERSQGPLVARASAWFSSITEGRYSKLLVDHDDDERVLLAVRADDERLKVEELSEGTADQLFLALRLAAIEQRLEASTPVPLILDDALLAFDDARTIAALNALVKLGATNQVILFTHHEHVVELAKRELKSGEFALHELTLAALPA